MKDYRDYSLLAHNTFGIDARCSRFLEYESDDEAVQVAAILRQTQQPFIIIGGGSNLLLTKDFDGIVVRSGIKGITHLAVSNWQLAVSSEPTAKSQQPIANSLKSEVFPQPSALITCSSGEVFDDVVAYCINHGLYGMENLSLIPGDVGASAVQNIGAYGVEAKDFIRTIRAVEIATGNICVIDRANCDYAYRQSRFKHAWKNQYLILSVDYALSPVFEPRLDYGNIRSELQQQGISEPTARQLRDVIISIRNAKLPDPKVMGNAGSFFMNPIVPRAKYDELAAQYQGMPHYDVDADHVKIPAGWMIDQCGWKGRSLGRAGVHDRQALVLVNRGGATGSEIVALCEAIRNDVRTRFGIDIHPEVNIV